MGWTWRGFALESAAVRVGREASRRISSSLMIGGMDHGPYGDRDGSGLEVMVHDTPRQQAARLVIDTVLVSRLEWGGVPLSLWRSSWCYFAQSTANGGRGPAKNSHRHTAKQSTLVLDRNRRSSTTNLVLHGKPQPADPGETRCAVRGPSPGGTSMQVPPLLSLLLRP